MYTYQYVLLAAYCCLLFNKNTRNASIVILTAWISYYAFVLDLSKDNYYVASAMTDLFVGYILNGRFKIGNIEIVIQYRLVAYLAYFNILVTYFGWLLNYYGYDSFWYDTIYAVVSIVQLLILILRAKADGLRDNRDSAIQRFIFLCYLFDSRQTRDRMQ